MTDTEDDDDMRAEWSIAQELRSSHKNNDSSFEVSTLIRETESDRASMGADAVRKF